MKFQTGRIRANSYKQIDFLVNNCSDIKVKKSHRHKAAGWTPGDFESCAKSKLADFLASKDKSLRIDVIANACGEVIEFKAYRTHWADQFHGTFGA